MKRINNYGSLTAITVQDAGGVNVYVENNTTKSEHLFARILNDEPVINYFNALDKIEATAKDVNKNWEL